MSIWIQLEIAPTLSPSVAPDPRVGHSFVVARFIESYRSVSRTKKAQ